jgi:hypothetical protein
VCLFFWREVFDQTVDNVSAASEQCTVSGVLYYKEMVSFFSRTAGIIEKYLPTFLIY